MSNTDIEYKIEKPSIDVSDFVERFYLVANKSDFNKEMVVIPDGRIDLIFLISNTEPLSCTLLGLETKPSNVTFSAKTKVFGISFNLLAIEYIFHFDIANLVNTARILPANFWDITEKELPNFNTFCDKISKIVIEYPKSNIDHRKHKLFNLTIQPMAL